MNRVLIEAQSWLTDCMVEWIQQRGPSPAQDLRAKKGLVEMESLHRETIDRACGQFLAQGNWPNADPDSAILILARIESAQKICAQHLRKPAVPPPANQSDLRDYLRWTLIDYWSEEGANKWLSGQKRRRQ